MFKKNLTRKHLSDKIYKTIGFSKNFSGKIIDGFFELMISEIIKSNKVKISSFGTFVVKSKNKRIGRNPKTKVEVLIKPRKIVKFIPSQSLKDKIN
jgi:integration host factor subunit alpha